MKILNTDHDHAGDVDIDTVLYLNVNFSWFYKLNFLFIIFKQLNDYHMSKNIILHNKMPIKIKWSYQSNLLSNFY